MSKRVFPALLALIAVLASGCSLAQPENTETKATTDRLAGVFITTEYLDLFDSEAWIEENADAILDGEQVLFPGMDYEQPRIYAELVEESFTDSSGTTHTSSTYEFKGLDGLFLAEYMIYSLGETDELYRTVDGSDYIFDVHSTFKSSDSAIETELTGSIFLNGNSQRMVFYFNPIYQTADGKVYLVPGTGMESSPGQAAFQLTGTSTTTENGQSKTDSSRIEVKINCAEIAKKVVLIEMSENNTEIRRTEFLPGQMPEKFTVSNGTAYLIVEEHREGGVSRTIYQSGDDPIAVFYSTDGKLCLKSSTTVQWQEN